MLINSLYVFQYYSLDITYFKSSLDSHLLDLLWNKYWVNTLSSSPLLGNGDYVAGQISDLGNFWCVYAYALQNFMLQLLMHEKLLLIVECLICVCMNLKNQVSNMYLCDSQVDQVYQIRINCLVFMQLRSWNKQRITWLILVLDPWWHLLKERKRSVLILKWYLCL